MRGYVDVLLDTIKSERLVLLVPIAFVNFFAVGYVLHGVVFGFKTLELAQIIVCVTLAMMVFFGEMVLLLIPTKVIIDRRLSPSLRSDKEIIRLSFDEQDREIFRRLKVASNSLTLMLTGLINYFLIAFFMFLWYGNDGKQLPAYTVVNALAPVYIFFVVLNFLALAYDLLKGKPQ
jgi:hypothetical protein